MKKLLCWVLGVIVIIGICIGGYFLFFAPGNSGDFTLQVTLDNGQTVLMDEKISPEENQSLLDIMKDKCEGLSEESGLITSIYGYSQDFDTNVYWFYTINGEFAMVGASEYYPESGDVIVFDLHEWVDDALSDSDAETELDTAA